MRGTLDRLDDAPECGVRTDSGDADLEHAGLIDGAGEDLGSRQLFDLAWIRR